MDITLDKQTNTDASIKIKLQEADYQPKVNEKLKEYSKKAQIKGFRPGKVPPSLIKKMYGKGIMVEEINQLLNETVTNYIKENKLSIVGDPLPDTEKAESIDWDTQKEFEFSYNVGLVPDFKVELEKVAITQYNVELSESEMQETVSNLQKRYGNNIQPDTTAEGDFIYGNLKQVDGAINKEKAFISLETVKKDLLSQFIGVSKEQTITFDIENTFENAQVISNVTGTSPEEAASLKGKFEFTVTDIDRNEPAGMDKEFFDKILGKDAVQNEEEFLNKLRELLQENYKKEADRMPVQEIRKQVVDNTDIVLPDDFLKRWLKATNDKVTEEVLEKEYHLYVSDLKWSLIKNKIAEENGIKVEHEDVLSKTKELIRQQFTSMGMGAELEDNLDNYANNFLKADKGKNYMNIFEQVLTDRIVDHIKTQAAVTDKTVSSEEFKKLNENEAQ